MNKWINLFALFLLACCLFACQSSSMSPQELSRWIEKPESGLIKTRTMADFQFAVQTRPASWISWRELADQQPNMKQLQDTIARRNQLSYFSVGIKLKDSKQSPLRYNLSDYTEYQDRVQFIAYDMQEDFRLIQGQDTLQPVLYHFERSYDLSPELICMMAFNLPEIATTDRQIIWDDRLFSTGPHRFHFSQEDLTHIPDIKL